MMSIQNGNLIGVCMRTKIMSKIVREAATVIGHIYERKELKI